MGNDSEPFEEDHRVLVELDSRRRASLGELAGDQRRFLAHVEPGGVIILEPAIVVTRPELDLMRNPALAAEIEQALTGPRTRVRRGRSPGQPTS